MVHKIVFDSISGHIYIKHCHSDGEAKTDLVTVLANCEYDITEQVDKMSEYRAAWKKDHNIKHSVECASEFKWLCTVCGLVDVDRCPNCGC
jgi:hypothetical protein